MNHGLLATLFMGLFIILGALVGYFTNKNDKIVGFSISMAFIVMIFLSVFELVPEVVEHMNESINSNFKYVLLILLIISGVVILKGLDHFIPDHDNDKNNDKNLYHIGIVSSVALVLHNIIEGMTIYSTVNLNSKMGLLMLIGVGLHNIPMGLVIYSTLSQNKKKSKIFFLSIISISTFIGGLTMYLLGNLISDLVISILLSLTLGMIIYIILFELLGEIIEMKNKKISILGFISGIIIFLISLGFE